MKVAVFSTKEFEKSFLVNENKNGIKIHFINDSLSLDTAGHAKDYDAVSIFSNDDASAPVLNILKDLGIKYITIRAAGYDQIDLVRAAENFIKVANVPEYSPYAIAEHTIAMILAMNRKLIVANEKVRRFDFSLSDLIGFDLNGKTVGIIGLGKIGGIVAKILNGFGCKIIAYDLKQDQHLIDLYDIKYVDLHNLYHQSDIITLHAPLNPQSKYIINKDSINLMKEKVMIVNTGRGGLINTIDAINGLKSGKIGYLGLDVYEKERELFFYDHSHELLMDDVFSRLLSFKNVLITGHQAFLTENALKNIAETTLYNLNCWKNQVPCCNELS